jgi:thermitase
MNKKNIWFHLTVALVLIATAAIIGQFKKKFDERREIIKTKVEQTKTSPITTSRSEKDSEPEALVKFKSNVSLAEIKKIAAKNNDVIEDEIEIVNNLVAIDDLDGFGNEQIAEQYAQMSDLVEYAEPNFAIQIAPTNSDYPNQINFDTKDNPLLPNDPMFADQWALNNNGQEGGKEKSDISAIKAWEKTKGSDKVVIAVLDTGVDYTHLDLISNIWIRPNTVPSYKDDELGSFDDTYGYDATQELPDPMDDNGHGTHCAGIIGAEGDNSQGIVGVNWQVQIMPLKFLGRSGYGDVKNAIEAINYAIDRKRAGVNIRVISASWGSTRKSKALEEAIRKAGEEGILFIAAAGNDASDNDKRPHYPSNYNLPNVISVAALDRNDNLASFSNYGVKTVHVAAPGKDILSTWLDGSFREASGTSMATPYVSGVAGLILANNPKISVEKLREKILSSVDKLPSLEGKVENGGRINAAKAVAN